MNKAREEYYEWSSSLSTIPFDPIKNARIYISELEQHNAELQKFNVGLADENCKLKEQKAELVGFIDKMYTEPWIKSKEYEDILKKYLEYKMKCAKPLTANQITRACPHKTINGDCTEYCYCPWKK